MGAYREHQYPQETGIPNSVNKNRQIERFQRVINQVKSMDSNRVVIIGDINCDMLEGNRVLGRYDIKQMIADYTEFMEDHRFTLMNHKPTRHWPGTPSTLIDHVVTNQPMNIDNVIMKPTHISDHDMVSCNYHGRILKKIPKIIKVRDYTLLAR